MKIVRSVTILLLILLGIATLIVPVTPNTAPAYPDMANVTSAWNYLVVWYDDNMPNAEYHVNEAYSAVSGLASDYRDSIVSGDVAFSSLTSAVQEKVIGMFMSIANLSYALAKNMAKTHTLHSATESGISHHTQRLYNYNELWDKHGTVYREAVYAAIRIEIQNTGQFVIDADSYMEAYYAYEFCVEDYNQSVEAWNAYAPSQQKDTITANSHSKAEFDKFRCFGGCGYEHDTLDYARDTHKVDCGTAENIEEIIRRAGLAAASGGGRRAGIAMNAAASELRSRNVDDGCGRPYWACNLDDREAHEKQICSVSSCPVEYRNCLDHTRDHENHGTSSEVSYTVAPSDATPDCSYCTDGCSSCDSPTDDTPNCPDCTSHCSSPCLCSNSGTCNGTVSYHVCGEHETTVSGDHSLQASCSLTDANGNSCTVTNFYACQSHTCVFPAPPPPPTTVSCGRSGCSESVSSANEHRVGPCSACGQSYWSCSWSASYWENEHRLRTCRYGTCGNTWRRCTSETPDCSSPNRQGKKCWAADP